MMSNAQAWLIFSDIHSNTYSDEDKLTAIRIIASFATFNSIKKDWMLEAIKWLLANKIKEEQS